MHGHISGTRILQVPSHRPLKQILHPTSNVYITFLLRVIFLDESTLRFESPSSNPHQTHLLNYYSVIIRLSLIII